MLMIDRFKEHMDCPYCHDSNYTMLWGVCGGDVFHLDFIAKAAKMIMFGTNGDYDFDINYCPYCGRKL